MMMNSPFLIVSQEWILLTSFVLHTLLLFECCLDTTASHTSLDSTPMVINSIHIGNSTNEQSTRLQSKDFYSSKGFWGISGIALSRYQEAPSGEPILYVVNDRGGSRRRQKIRLGIYDSGTGERLLTLRLTSLPFPFDVESMTIGPCNTITTIPNDNRTNNNNKDNPISSTSSSSTSSLSSSSCIYVGDTGDNRARRSHGLRSGRKRGRYCIYQLREPIWQHYSDNDEYRDDGRNANNYHKVLMFNYHHESSPIQYADSETLFLDHASPSFSPDLYLVTKWSRRLDRRSFTRLYKIPSSAWNIATTSLSSLSYFAGEENNEKNTIIVYSPHAYKISSRNNNKNKKLVKEKNVIKDIMQIIMAITFKN